MLRKEGCRRRSGARERLRRLRTPALRTDADQRDKCDSRRPQPQRLNKGTKKDAMCKHKKSGCVCFIVARLRASALRDRDIGDNKALCAPAEPTAKLRIYARTRKSHRNKTEIFFSIKLSSGQNAGERNKTARPSQQTRELFSIFSPTPLVAASSNSFAPHCGSHSRPRACTRIQPFFDYCLHRSPPPSIPIRMWQLGVKTLHLFAVHRHHPKRETQLIDFSAAKPLRFGGTAWVNFCFFPSSPESSPVSR